MIKSDLIKNRMFAIVVLSICVLAANISAQDMAVPANLQAALFKKIFTFNRTLQAKGNFEVAVIGASGNDLAVAFKEAGVNAKAVSGDQIPGTAAVVYVMPGTNPPTQLSASKGVLSISGVTSNVESGKVAIGLGVEGGKPKIIIHMGQLKAEKQDVSADLLKIATVIQ